MRHMKKELSMENLLFVTVILQWQDYLIDKQLWNDKNINCKLIINATKQIKLPKSIPTVPMIENIKYNNLNKRNNSINVKDDSIWQDFDMFIPVFNEIYRQYIEANKAPLEVNISYESRNKMKLFYQQINHEQCHESKKHRPIINSDNFWKMWYNMYCICEEVAETIVASMVRCPNLIENTV